MRPPTSTRMATNAPITSIMTFCGLPTSNNAGLPPVLTRPSGPAVGRVGRVRIVNVFDVIVDFDEE